MRVTHTTDEADQDTHAELRIRHRLAALLTVLLVILLLAFIPPLINVNRFQRRIARNIGNAVGRPVHFDRVSLSLLPLPGFTLENFVVDEDPAFGFEPILRADQVQVTLRISSLWGRRVEFSRIALTEPTSVNLVRAADGKWNIESLLLQASHIEAAPTAQRFAGPAARFPYIQATGARVNLKLGQEKVPFSLADADFALWLPEPHQWHLRLEAHPIRTDTSPGETGILRMEGTLGGIAAPTGDVAASLAQIPIDLRGAWQNAQLGGLSSLVLGRDAGLRGDVSLTFEMVGSIGHNGIASNVRINNARRAEFVPPHTLSLEAACHTISGNTFHSFSNIECHWPPADSSDDPSTLILTAEVPDVRRPESSSVKITLPAVPAATFFDWLSVASPHPPTGLTGPGTLSASLNWRTNPRPSRSTDRSMPRHTWAGELEFSGGALELDSISHRSIPLGDMLLRSSPPSSDAPYRRSRSAGILRTATQDNTAADSFDILPVAVPLGGKQPATLEGHLDDTGYSLHITGTIILANLLEVGNAVPQLGEGLAEFLSQIADSTLDTGLESQGSGIGPTHDLSNLPIRVDMTATRAWGGPQIWRQTVPSSAHIRRFSHK